MNSTWLILVAPLGIILGIFIASLISKLKLKSNEKKLIKDAQKVMNGEKENIFDLDGKKLDVKRFKVRNDKDKEVRMIFKDGGIEEEEVKETEEEVKVKEVVFLEEKKKPKEKDKEVKKDKKAKKKQKRVKKEAKKNEKRTSKRKV